MTREAELAWLAGIVDGEGCIKINKFYKTRYGEKRLRPKPSTEIVVGMTHKETVDRCREIAGYGSESRREFKDRKKPCYFWGIYGDNAKEIGRLILPYSVTKAERIREMLGEVTTT